MSTPGTPRSQTRVLITSNIVARPTPPKLPPYEPLLSAVLRQRLLYTIFAFSIASQWCFTLIWVTWHGYSYDGWDKWRNLFTNALQPSLVLLALAYWTVGVLPVIILRKVYLTVTPTSGSSPLLTLRKAIQQRIAFRALFVYTNSAVLLAALYMILSEPQARLSLFVKSRKHPYTLNTRPFFILCMQVFAASFFTLRAVLRDHFLYRAHPSPSLSRLATYITPFSLASIAVPISVLLTYIVPAFMPFRVRVSSPPVFRGWLLSFMTLIAWEFSDALFEFALHAAPLIATPASTPEGAPAIAKGDVPTLLSTLMHPSSPSVASEKWPGKPALAHYFALAELLYAPPKQMFADVNAGTGIRSSLGMMGQGYWGLFVRQALGALGSDYQRLLRRGAPEPPAVAAVPPPPKVTETPAGKKLDLISKPIYSATPRRNSPLKNVLDAIASDGQIATAVGAGVAVGAGIGVPELFQSTAPSPAANVEAKVEAAVKGVENHLQQALDDAKGRIYGVLGKGKAFVGLRDDSQVMRVGKKCVEWWTRERPHRKAEESLTYRDFDILYIEVLARFVCVSLTDDQYGVVQRDIPRILEAFLKYLDALEEYQAEFAPAFSTPALEGSDGAAVIPQTPIEERAEWEKAEAREVLLPLIEALQEGVSSIVRTFGNKLVAFKFPPQVARKLQGFFDYAA